MATIAGKEFMSVAECVEYLGVSRATISKNIALTKKGRMKPPFPFFSPYPAKSHVKYFFRKEAIDRWVDMRSVE